jgi:uroporphyrin-III C-methyltransferase
MTDFPAGMVWLVGAGPGDPELLTRKAARLIGEASVVFHDALVGPEILALTNSGARLEYVGKRSGRHSKDQATIDRLIVAAALSGEKVVRLKGGDPTIFGRVAEEIDACRSAGLMVRICPGVTTACAAAAGGLASLTLRGAARGITFVTAHLRNGEPLQLDWEGLASPQATLGIYMGRAAAAEISRQLIAAGRHPDTPVMVAVNVSRADERLIRGKLSALSFLVAAISDDDPTLLLIGEAVANGHAPAENVCERVVA